MIRRPSPMIEGVEVAALRFILATAQRCDHDLALTLGAIDQHPAAQVASAVDDAWVDALNRGEIQ